MSQANMIIFALVAIVLMAGWQIDRAHAWKQKHQVRTFQFGKARAWK